MCLRTKLAPGVQTVSKFHTTQGENCGSKMNQTRCVFKKQTVSVTTFWLSINYCIAALVNAINRTHYNDKGTGHLNNKTFYIANSVNYRFLLILKYVFMSM